MSDESNEEISSLYKSMKKRNYPTVNKNIKKKFQTQNAYLKGLKSEPTLISSRLGRSSQTNFQGDSRNKFIPHSRQNETNVFADILNKNVENSEAINLHIGGHTSIVDSNEELSSLYKSLNRKNKPRVNIEKKVQSIRKNIRAQNASLKVLKSEPSSMSSQLGRSSQKKFQGDSHNKFIPHSWRKETNVFANILNKNVENSENINFQNSASIGAHISSVDSDEEVSSLYKSIKRKNIPTVKEPHKKRFQSILEKTRAHSASLKDMKSESSSESSELGQKSQTNFQGDILKKVIPHSRRKGTNVFSDMLNEYVENSGAINLQTSTHVDRTPNLEKNNSQNAIKPIERSDSLNSLDSNDSNIIPINQESFLSNEQHLKVREPDQKYSRAQVLSIANAFSSISYISESHNSHTSSSESPRPVEILERLHGKVGNSSQFNAQHLSLKVQRNSVKQLPSLENNLIPATQNNLNEIIGSYQSSSDDNIETSVARKKFKKSNLNDENIMKSKLSAANNREVLRTISSLKINQDEIHGKPERGYYEREITSHLTGQNKLKSTATFHNKPSPSTKVNSFSKLTKNLPRKSDVYGNSDVSRRNITQHYEINYVDNQSSGTNSPQSLNVNVNSKTFASHNNSFDLVSSFSDLTFDSAVLKHSIRQSTPIPKQRKDLPHNVIYENDKERYAGSKNRVPSNYKHNDLEVMAQKSSTRNRNEEKHPSHSLTRDQVISHNNQHTDVSKKLSRVRNKSESHKMNTFIKNKSNYMTHQIENKSNRPITHSWQSNTPNDNEGVLFLRSASKRKPKEMTNSVKIAASTSRHVHESSYVNSEPELPIFKKNSQPKIKLPVKKTVCSQKNARNSDLKQGVHLNQTDNSVTRTVGPSRKFVVRGITASLKHPAEWVNKRFYNKLIPFFETKVGPFKCYSLCESMVIDLYNNVKIALRKPKEQVKCVKRVRKILYDVGVIKTPMDFMLFAEEYLPNEFNFIAIPKNFGKVGVPYPTGIGLFDDLKL